MAGIERNAEELQEGDLLDDVEGTEIFSCLRSDSSGTAEEQNLKPPLIQESHDRA